MTPKSGKEGSPVDPAPPEEAKEADTAEPGGVSSQEAEPGSTEPVELGEVKVHKPPSNDDDTEEKTWIEIRLVDQDNEPVAGEAYQVTLPDGSVDSGTLGPDGLARIEGIDPGECKVTFPNLDGSSWKKV